MGIFSDRHFWREGDDKAYSDPAKAEESFRTALAIAREQGTRGYELRAATSLTRLQGLSVLRIRCTRLPVSAVQSLQRAHSSSSSTSGYWGGASPTMASTFG